MPFEKEPGDNPHRFVEQTGWHALLTNQMRVLLFSEPLLHLHSKGDSRRGEALQHYDGLPLALKLFAEILDHTGLEDEIKHEDVLRVLSPLLSAMDQRYDLLPRGENHLLMVEYVLGILLNEKRGRRPYKIVYTDFQGGQVVERELTLRYLTEEFGLDGSQTVLRLSHELTNLLLRGLTIRIEDWQVATEAVVEYQLASGRFGEAIQSAQLARTHSINLCSKLERIFLDTRNNIRQVNWREDMPRMIEEIMTHIARRFEVEDRITQSAREKRDEIDVASEQTRQLSEIIHLMTDCRQRHMLLQQKIDQTQKAFFYEQERQAFALDSYTHLPQLITDALEPLLQITRAQALSLLPQLWSASQGAKVPEVFSLTSYLEHQLQPRRERPAESVPAFEPDLELLTEENSQYSLQLRQECYAYLGQLHGQYRLQEILDQAHQERKFPLFCDFLLWILLSGFTGNDPDFQAHKVDEKQYITDHIQCNDILITFTERG